MGTLKSNIAANPKDDHRVNGLCMNVTIKSGHGLIDTKVVVDDTPYNQEITIELVVSESLTNTMSKLTSIKGSKMEEEVIKEVARFKSSTPEKTPPFSQELKKKVEEGSSQSLSLC